LSTPSPDWHHKTLWPLDTRDYVTLALATIGLILAAGEGMGGGVILVPLFILVLDLPLRRAIPLSNVTILVRRSLQRGEERERKGVGKKRRWGEPAIGRENTCSH